jgi:poly(3-hydroxybutyrate) depolymerase
LAYMMLAQLVACGGGASEPVSQPDPGPTAVPAAVPAVPAAIPTAVPTAVPTTVPATAPTPAPPIEPSAPATAPAHGTQGSGGAAGPRQAHVSVDGVQRSYFVYAPNSALASATSDPVPLVIALHGAGDSGGNFAISVGLTQSADAKNYVLAAADAYTGSAGVSAWLLAATQGWPGADGSSNSLGNDLQLITRIVQDIGTSYNIDKRKIYAAGFSRGAGFTVLMSMASNNASVLSGQWSSPFAAYAVSAGYDPLGSTFSIGTASPKRPIWFLHGTADGQVPFSTGRAAYDRLIAAGWPSSSRWTAVTNAPHYWLWNQAYGHSNGELIDWFYANTLL